MAPNRIHSSHADDVLSTFKATLGDDATEQLGDEHLSDLALLIESAIDAAIIERLEAIADDLEKMAASVRFEIEHRHA